MKKKISLKMLSCFFAGSLFITGCNKQISSNENSTVAKTADQLQSSGNGICDYNLDEQVVISQGYAKIYDEEFTSGYSNWNTWIGGAYNHELQCYQAANLQVTNGNLVITTKKETVTGPKFPGSNQQKTFNYSSGRIESKAYFTPSASAPKVRISARIKLPPGYGMWPAFWTYNDPWPTKGEMDIIESQGQTPFQYTTNYYYGTIADKPLTNENITTGHITSDVSLTDCYHVYEVIWTKDSLAYLLDGKIIATILATSTAGKYIPAMFGKLERIALNVAVGGNYFTNFDPSKIQTGTMYVDWVKVFTSN